MVQQGGHRRSTRAGWIPGAGVLLLLVGLAFFVQAGRARADDPPTTTASVVTLSGDQGSLPNGADYVWRAGPDRITASSYQKTIQVEAVQGASGTTHDYTVQLSPPQGADFITGTRYVTTNGSQTPMVRVYGDDGGCNPAGSFTVLDYVPDLSRLWVTFLFNCQFSTATTHGEIRINEPVDADVIVAPSRVEWPTQYIGGSARHVPITVINTAAQPLSVSRTALGGTNPDDFPATAPNGCANIPAGGSCAVDVGFTPTATGDRSATLTLTDSSAEGTHAVPLSGSVGPASTVSAVYEAATAGGGLAWRTGPDQVVATITTGGVAVGVAHGTGYPYPTYRFVAPAGQQLVVGQTYAAKRDPSATADDATIAVGGSCNTEYGTFTVRDLQPDVNRAWFTFTDHCNDPTAPTVFGEVRLGEPTNPELLVAPSRISWPDQGIGAPAKPFPVTLVNTGQKPVTVYSVVASGSAAGDISVPSLGSCATIAVAATCTFDVGFIPSALNERTATLTILDSSAAGSETVELAGRGVPQATVTMTTTAPSGRFDAVTGSESWHGGVDHIGIKGSPSGLVIGANHTKTDTDPNQFRLSIAPATGRLKSNTAYPGATGQGSSGNVGYQPGTPAIALTQHHQSCLTYSGQFTVLDIADDLSRLWVEYEVDCSGTTYFGEVRYGEPADADAFVTPRSVAWPQTWSGQTTGAVPVTVTNTGPAPFTILGASVDGISGGNFAVDPTACAGVTLTPGQDCSFAVTRQVPPSRSEAATLTITDTSPSGAHYVDLTGFAPNTTTATLIGTAGDPITGGAAQLFRSGADQIELRRDGASRLQVSLGHGSDADAYQLTFDAPAGTPLTSGATYEGAQTVAGQPSLGHPGITITSHGLTCDSTGRFVMHDLAPDLSRAWIDYEIHCLNGIQFGELRYREPTDADVALAPVQVDWPATVQGAVPVNVVNVSAASLSVTDLQISGPAAGDFSTTGVGPCTTIEPGAVCTVEVSFTPKGPGARQATLSISDSAAPSPHTVELSGPGLAPTPAPTHTTAPPPPAPIKTTVTTKNSAKSVKVHKTMKVAVTVTPAQKGRSVQLQQLSGSKWKTVSTTKTDSKGHATFSVKPSKKGTVTYRAQAVADSKHATGTSKKFTIRAT